MTGCNQYQARLTENTSLGFKHTYHRDVISVQSILVPSLTRGRKLKLETRLQERNEHCVQYIYWINLGVCWTKKNTPRINAIRQWLSTAGCIFTLKPRFIYFLLGYLNNLFGYNLNWLSTREYEIRGTTLVKNNSSYFWIHARGEVLLANSRSRYTQQDDHVSRNQREVFSGRCILFAYLLITLAGLQKFNRENRTK